MKIKSKEHLSKILQSRQSATFRRFNRSKKELEYFILVGVNQPELTYDPTPYEPIIILQKVHHSYLYGTGYRIEVDYETLQSCFVYVGGIT